MLMVKAKSASLVEAPRRKSEHRSKIAGYEIASSLGEALQRKEEDFADEVAKLQAGALQRLREAVGP